MTEGARSKAYHQDSRRFQDALTHTVSETGFSARLIEKDYYCSILLEDLGALFKQGLVFKGGTCLSKVHAKFFRLSEDLDFAMSVKSAASRGDRRRAAEPIKGHLAGVVARHPFFSEVVVLTGQNNNKQYNGKLAYRSIITGEDEHVKIEVSLREEVLLPSEELAAKTILIDPLSGAAAIPPIVVRALSLQEAYAEKARAALTRRDPAIRDFFDIDNAVRNGLLQHRDPGFLHLVSQKLALTEDSVDTSAERIGMLARQIETQLKPVLRLADYEQFVLDRVVALLLELLAASGKK